MQRPPASIPPADTIPVRTKPTLTYRMARRLVLIPALRTVFSIRITGREKLRAQDGAYVAVGNHNGWLDGPLMAAVLPPKPRPHIMGDPTTFLKAGRIAWWGLRHYGGFICVDRSNHNDPVLRRTAVECLDKGGVLSLFPEARYGRQPGESFDELLPFKKGFAHFASEAGVPVVPIVYTGTTRLWLRKRVTATVLDPISTVGKSIDEIVAETHSAMAAHVVPDVASSGNHRFERFLTYLDSPKKRARGANIPPPGMAL